MTSSNGNIFRVTGHLCGEFTSPGDFPAQRPVTRSFDVFFNLPLNKRLTKQPWDWWFEAPSWSLWRQCNAVPAVQWQPPEPPVTTWLVSWQFRKKCEGILPKGPYLPWVSMAGRALLAGYHRICSCLTGWVRRKIRWGCDGYEGRWK